MVLDKSPSPEIFFIFLPFSSINVIWKQIIGFGSGRNGIGQQRKSLRLQNSKRKKKKMKKEYKYFQKRKKIWKKSVGGGVEWGGANTFIELFFFLMYEFWSENKENISNRSFGFFIFQLLTSASSQQSCFLTPKEVNFSWQPWWLTAYLTFYLKYSCCIIHFKTDFVFQEFLFCLKAYLNIWINTSVFF